MDYWVNDVPRVEDGKTTFSAGDMNKIIDSLVSRTDYLHEALINLSGNQGYIMADSGFTSSCKKGTLVSRRADGVYEPAEARWSGDVRADGSWIQDSKSNVVGILLSDPAEDGSGIIMSAGWSADPALIDILAPDGVVGDYYLTEEGKASCAPMQSRAIRVYCYSYLGTGKITINPERAEYAGHAHNRVRIKTQWISILNPATAPAILPPEAKSYIMVTESTDESLYSLLRSNPQYPCLVKNGTEVDTEDWGITQSPTEVFIYLNFIPVDTDIFQLHAITPLLADEPLVRSIKTTRDNNLLTVNSVGGQTWLGLNLNPLTTNNFTGFGITSMTSGGISTGPMIQGIKAGPGIDVKSYRDKGSKVAGVFEISNSQYKNTLIDMNLCNLNGVLVGTSVNEVSYIFPAGVKSSLTGTIRIPHFINNSEQCGEVVLVFQGNGQSISGVKASILVQSTPTSGGSTPIATPVIHSISEISGTDAESCYCSIVPLGGNNQSLYSDGLIICTLTSAGNAEINLLSASFRLT